jgi:hypothetical protein
MKVRAAAVLLALAACVPQEPQPAEQPPPSPPQDASPSAPLDPFVVMIDAERWGVIIDRAMEGARMAAIPSADFDQSEMYRADAALKEGAAALIELRNRVCGQGLVTGDACQLRDWPEWTREPPTDQTPIEEIERRSQWLGEIMGPFTAAGCEEGRKATGEDLFCSVE